MFPCVGLSPVIVVIFIFLQAFSGVIVERNTNATKPVTDDKVFPIDFMFVLF